MNVYNFWKAVLTQDEQTLRMYFHEDASVNWHCTNEHFSVDEFLIANCEYPDEAG
jgi:hypothetical protein